MTLTPYGQRDEMMTERHANKDHERIEPETQKELDRIKTVTTTRVNDLYRLVSELRSRVDALEDGHVAEC